MVAWVDGSHGPVRVRTRRSVLRRHPVAVLVVVLLIVGVVFLALALMGVVPGWIERVRKAKIVTGYSGKKYTVEEAVDRADKPHSQEEKKKQSE